MPTRHVPRIRLGERLVSEGLLTESAVARALGYQRESAHRVKIGSILLSWDLVSEEGLLRSLASFYHCEAVTGAMLTGIPAEVVGLLTSRDAIRLGAIPYAAQKTRVRVGFVNPGNLAAVDEVSNLTGRLCVPGIVTEIRLLQAHRRYYYRSIPYEFRPALRRLEPVDPAQSQTPADHAGSFLPYGSGEAVPPPGDSPWGERDESPAPIPVVAEAAAAPEGLEAAGPSAADPSPVPPSPPETPADAGSLWIETPRQGEDQSDDVAGMWTGSASLAPSVQDLLELAVGTLPPELPRVLLFGEGADCVRGLAGRAEGVTPERLAATEVSYSTETVFSRVRRTSVPHFGPLSSALWPPELAKLLGTPPPPCALFEIRAAGIRAFLYADRVGRVLLKEDRERVARSAATIAELAARWLPPGQRVLPAS